MVATFAVMKSTSYYTRQSALSYYANAEATGVWLRGHESLGIATGDIVRPEDFDRICTGVGTKGNLLVKSSSAGPRMLGIDVTCSSPKSVSVEFAFGGPERRQVIAGCEREALEAVVRLVEREIPLARRGRGGAKKEQAKFVAAVFTHSETRPETHADGTVMSDPQRHHHICFPNIAERADGTWGGINSVGFRSWRNAIGAIYRLELATTLQRRGYQIERGDEDDWKWSLAGIPKDLCELFSARRAALEETLAQAGTTSSAAPGLAAAINATDRKRKLDLGLDELTQRWRQAAENAGYDPNTIGATIREPALFHEREQAKLQEQRKDRIDPIPALLTEHGATISRRDLIAKTANALVGTRADLDEALASADAMIATQSVIELGETRDGAVYTTPQMLAAERALVALVSRNANEKVKGPDPRFVRDLVEGSILNEEQREVVSAATSGRRLTLVQGGAGTGKSTSLMAIARAWQQSGFTVLGAAVAWRAANGLRGDLGIEARAIDSWLKSIETGNRPFDKRTCLLIEEGGLQSTPQALRLLKEIDRAGGVAVIVGDEDQLRPVGPGHAMRLIRESIGATRIDTVVRQRDKWARAAPALFSQGEARQAIDAFNSRGLMHGHADQRATIQALADRWQELTKASPEKNLLVVAKTNAEVRALSSAIRARRRERGEIVGPDIIIEAADASGNRHPLPLAIGDGLRFLKRNDELGVINGSHARIVGLETERDGTLKITANKDGREFTFSPTDVADAKGRARLAHDTAATLFQAQGLTVDSALVLLSPRFDRHDAYVASSRARESTEFFYDAKTIDQELSLGQQLDTAERVELRLAFLAARLERRSVKTNALDVIAETRREAALRRELVHEL